MKLALLFLMAFVIQAVFGFFFLKNYFRLDLPLLFFLIYAMFNPVYQKVLPMGLIIGLFSGLNSIFPISLFLLSYLMVGILAVFSLNNFFSLNIKNIFFIGFFLVFIMKLFQEVSAKLFFILNISQTDIIFNSLIFKNAAILAISEGILLFLFFLWWNFGRELIFNIRTFIK